MTMKKLRSHLSHFSIISLISVSGLVMIGCRGDGIPYEAELYEVAQAAIADGLYILGGTDQGLEVSGDQYRYYSEGGEEEWRPVVELTAIQDGVIFDGRNYWCINTPTEPGVCTENGWRTVEERLQEQAEAEASSIAPSELTIGGFERGAQPADVNRQLGQPTQISQGYYTRYEYPGFTAWFDADYLVDMLSTSPEYCTPSGVCPGMTAAEVRQIYGTPTMNESEEGRFMEYYADGETCWLKIRLDGEIVRSVAAVCLI